MWTRLLAILLMGLSLQPALPLTATWQPAGLHVAWSAAEPGCLVLVGGGLATQRLADIPCAASGDVVLARGGDYLMTPVNRTHVELRAMSDLTRTLDRTAIPARYTVVLPIVVSP